MQTFLPYPDFWESAATLDNARLGKQRLETRQILSVLGAVTDVVHVGWSRHPAVRMWSGHELALARYGLVVCLAWRNRGFRDSLLPWFASLEESLRSCDWFVDRGLPWWFGVPNFHAAHRRNLLRKSPGFYGRLGWPETAGSVYWWPGWQGFMGERGFILQRVKTRRKTWVTEDAGFKEFEWEEKV